MTKAEFLKYVANKIDKPVAQIDETLSAMIECITNTIVKGDKLGIPGLGAFSMKQRKAREGRNPKTGEIVKIPAKKVPHFSAGKTLKEAVNN